MSITETFLASIMNELVPSFKEKGFKAIAYSLSENIFGSPKYGDYLYALYIIRNSLHNNGCNMSSNLEIIVEGKKFLFERGKKISNASWMELFLLCKKMLEAVIDIVNSDRVKAISYISHTNSDYLCVLDRIKEE